MSSLSIAPVTDSLVAFLSQSSYSNIIVLTDNNTKRFCYPVLKYLLPKHRLISIESGEQHKNLETCNKIWSAMTLANLDRHALMINLGGGVIGDMGGFCAATYKRGIDFIQIPTTLLSQVDASVGGKLGIDFHGFKNHIGVFNIPKHVLIDPFFLQTLSFRELRSGFAEIIKHTLIGDGEKWHEIRKKDLVEQDLPTLIAHSVAFKQSIVTQDPTEKSIRKILNFGHTLGHAIETYFLSNPKKRLLHGEAIAVGMVCEAFIAYKKKMIRIDSLEEIEAFIFSIYGNINLQVSDIEPIIELTLHDKKNKGKEVRFSLINGIGSCSFDILTTKNEMSKAILYYIGQNS